MMQVSDLANALSIIITAFFGFIVFYVFWQGYVIDETRQRLFELRDELFDLAMDGEIAFDSEVYVVLRKMFNSTIRYSHTLDWLHLIVFIFVSKKMKGNLSKSALHVEHLVKNIENEHIRHKVEKIIRNMHMTTALHIYRRSLALMFVMTPIAVVMSAFFRLGEQFLSRTPRRFQTLLNARAYSEVC